MRIRSLRISSQVLFLVISIIGIFGVGMSGLIYPYFLCVACPGAVANCPLSALQHSVLGIESGSWLKLGLYTLGFIGLMGILVGRAFCGWACPVGSLQDIVSPVSSRLGKKLNIPRFWEARYLKYGLLFLLVLVPFFSPTKWFCLYCPGGFVTATVPTWCISWFSGELWVPGKYLGIKIVWSIFFFILILMVTRGWCRFLCPYGALVGPMNKVSILNVKRDEARCIHCNACTRACTMEIDVVKSNRSNECILCGRCVDVCPVSCLDYRIAGKGTLCRPREKKE